MEVEIWSDVLCPFCYIGKRNFEAALKQFPHREDVNVVWRSFELDPNAKKDYGMGMDEVLAGKYGKTVQWAVAANKQMVQRAATAGLTYNMEKIIPTNSFDAHRLIHLADTHGLQDKAKERLLAAYFTEGKKISDHAVLKQLGIEIGLGANEIDAMLAGEDYAYEVRTDEAEAQTFGINGVPYFVFDRKYGVSGAQPVEVFTETLNQVWNEKDGHNEAEDK